MSSNKLQNCKSQAMMKDPFGNYVVQKVLETCDDKSRELILSRIKVHLTALKRYTYGKHIVSRVEKLVAAGGKTKLSTSTIYFHQLQFLTLQINSTLTIHKKCHLQKGTLGSLHPSKVTEFCTYKDRFEHSPTRRSS